MSIAASSLSEVPISSQPGVGSSKKPTSKAPANRLLVAKSDIVAPPEPR
jgi:hypothetical protein